MWCETINIGSHACCSVCPNWTDYKGYLRIYVHETELVMPQWAHRGHLCALGLPRLKFVAPPHTCA